MWEHRGDINKMHLEYVAHGFVEYLDHSPIRKAFFQVNEAGSEGKYELSYRDGRIVSGLFDGKTLDPVYSRQYGAPPSEDGKLFFWGDWYKGLYAMNSADGSIAWHLRSSKIRNIFVYPDHLIALRCDHALLKIACRTGTILSQVNGTTFRDAWRLDEQHVLVDGRYNRSLLVDTVSMEIVRTYPIMKLVDAGRGLHPRVRDVWIEDGMLTVEGFEYAPNNGPHGPETVEFVRQLCEYSV